MIIQHSKLSHIVSHVTNTDVFTRNSVSIVPRLRSNIFIHSCTFAVTASAELLFQRWKKCRCLYHRSSWDVQARLWSCRWCLLLVLHRQWFVGPLYEWQRMGGRQNSPDDASAAVPPIDGRKWTIWWKRWQQWRWNQIYHWAAMFKCQMTTMMSIKLCLLRRIFQRY